MKRENKFDAYLKDEPIIEDTEGIIRDIIHYKSIIKDLKERIIEYNKRLKLREEALDNKHFIKIGQVVYGEWMFALADSTGAKFISIKTGNRFDDNIIKVHLDGYMRFGITRSEFEETDLYHDNIGIVTDIKELL